MMEIFVTAISGDAGAMDPQDGMTILAVHKSVGDAIEFHYAQIDEQIKDCGFDEAGSEDEHGTIWHTMQEPMDEMDTVKLSHWVVNGNWFMNNEYTCEFLATTREELK